jgi:hypothetical protein
MGMKDMRIVLKTAHQAAGSLAEHSPSSISCKCARSLAGTVINKDDSFDPSFVEGKTRTMFRH